MQAIIAVVCIMGEGGDFALQRRAAALADRPADKGRIAPTGAAQAKIADNAVTAANAGWRINQMQSALQSHDCSLSCTPMTPQLTDLTALQKNRARARDLLWHAEARSEAEDRLSLVKKDLTKIAIVTDYPEIWANFRAHDGAQTHIAPHGEVLPLAEGGFDAVIHAMGLHWAGDPVGQLVQCRRALRPDGLMLALMFGGQTLHELRSALAGAEAEISGGLSLRVLPMGEIRDLGGLIQRAGFALPVADSFAKTLIYRDIYHLMKDLRAFGETNALAARRKNFTRRALFARAGQIYAQHFPAPAPHDTGLRATFEMLCLSGWAPHESQQKPLRPGSAQQRLADALVSVEFALPQKDS
jgi:SAM-dependent methyltransferase